MYRTLLSYPTVGATPLSITRDLDQCAAECGWQEGTLAAQALDREYGIALGPPPGRATPRLLLQFREGRLRVPDDRDVLLVPREDLDRECRILVRAWPRFLRPEVSGIAPWERVLTRIVTVDLVREWTRGLALVRGL